jgi:nitrate reductase beta subunit
MRRPRSEDPHRHIFSFSLVLTTVTKIPEEVVVGLRNLAWAPNLQKYQDSNKKITQHNTNRTASQKSIFQIYILYEVISFFFPLPRLCLVCMPQMIISLCIK